LNTRITTEALYLREADDNGVELYRDRPKVAWRPNADGTIAMTTEALDLRALLREAT
jgi:catechol 2,3-dioxygenase